MTPSTRKDDPGRRQLDSRLSAQGNRAGARLQRAGEASVMTEDDESWTPFADRNALGIVPFRRRIVEPGGMMIGHIDGLALDFTAEGGGNGRTRVIDR